MTFWLARERRGQHSDWIPRFDPRFWTVNFPRPTMASVAQWGFDGLKVECEFQTYGELVGVIWESEDRLDHPLLAYATRRDYAHCVLRFHWGSTGVVALDQPHGPTLTIEGRDAQGTPRSWYVRLWNYATGSPEDADIELRFSDLQAGYVLPGEPVHPHDIDRMFISLVPQGYAESSTQPTPSRTTGSATVSAMRCEGENAMLAVGDVMLPAHGEQIATAYDDSFNQTPERLVRTVEALGYRGSVVHYVGMSHFYRIGRNPAGPWVRTDGEICRPARKWHDRYFALLVGAGLEPIVSLSYELFAENCPPDWQQRAHDGSPARTGWVPPSALLSPGNAEAMGWLRSVAKRFTDCLEAAGGRMRFQIGEPWWWVQPQTGAPCLYDDAARAALGGADGSWPVAITDMRAPLDAAQCALLDAAGGLLADSTAALAEAVRAAATGEPAEILLLAFTPTLLDPAMPELYRANLPTGWAHPAFDRLQLEDYDWLTKGEDARRAAGLAFVDSRLGYPLANQDYMAGFVLDSADGDLLWPRIDRALDEARVRGIGQRFVWALPQVSRDGYTRLPHFEDEDMQAFDDVAYPLALGRDAAVSPEFSTSVAVTASGHERRNALWSDARLRFDVGPGIRSEAELGVLIAFFRARYGPAHGFRLRDPLDHSSNAMTGAPTPTDQILGVGDGVTARFQLCKHYGEQIRPITRPVPESIAVSVDGVAASGWSHAGGGAIVFETAPPAGSQVRAGFLFDVPVRFAEDRIDVSGLSFAAGEAPSVPLIEIRESQP